MSYLEHHPAVAITLIIACAPIAYLLVVGWFALLGVTFNFRFRK
jgi:hypothetical protein